MLLQRFRGLIRLPEAAHTSVLLASARCGDEDALRGILEDSGWTAVAACSLEETLHMQERLDFPIVLYDQDLPGAEWRDGVGGLTRLHRPAVILLSDVADPYLWNEVVRAGGFDLLPRPFRRDDTLALLDFAHLHWKTGRRRHFN